MKAPSNRVLRPLGPLTWRGTILAYINAARRELDPTGRKLLYRDLHALLNRSEAEEERQAVKRAGSQ